MLHHCRRAISAGIVKMSVPKIEAVLIDLSGTIHIDDQPIDGAIQAIQRLRDSGLPTIFATNTTKESRQRLLTKLHRIGFSMDSDQLFSSLLAAQRLIATQSLKPHLMVEEAALDDFRPVCDVHTSLDQCDSIVIGLAPKTFNYDYLNHVFDKLLNSDKPLIAIHRSRYFQTKSGIALGPGPFVSALEYATGIQAKVVGKPDPFFFHEAIRQIGRIAHQNVAMIGDDVQDDVIGAQKAGLIGMLVRTGKYRTSDEQKTDIPPDFVFDSIVNAVDFILDHNQKCS